MNRKIINKARGITLSVLLAISLIISLSVVITSCDGKNSNGNSVVNTGGTGTGSNDPANDGVLSVPSEYATIQEALDAASTGDTVLVADGTYYENIVWPGVDGITLESEGSRDTAIIDGRDSGSVITITSSNITRDTVIDGFSIMNGNNVDRGGGIYIEQGSPTIKNNKIHFNISNAFGGGMYVRDSSPLISANMIKNNQTATSGGGIYIKSSGGLIDNNYIAANDGHGIVIDQSNTTISNNQFLAHSASGIYCYQSSPLISKNEIRNNDAVNGGGILVSNCAGNTSIVDNTITDNTADNIGGGIYCYNDSHLTITGNTIQFNSSGTCGGGVYVDETSSLINNTLATANVISSNTTANCTFCNGLWSCVNYCQLANLNCGGGGGSNSCSDCLASCRGLPSCCTGVGCICESACN